jgi:hypothetical protein
MGHSTKLGVIALTLTALAGGAAAPSLAGAAVPQDFVGIVSDDTFVGGHDYKASNFAAQHAAGIGLIRRTFVWAQIEQDPNAYDFRAYDDLVATAAEHGVRVLPVLFDPPAFRSSRPATNAKRGTYFPKKFSDLGDFGAAVARRYGVNGSLWSERPSIPKLPITSYQVWNEPNLPVYSQPRPDPKRYVALLKAAAHGIRAVDPKAEIVTAGLPDSRLSRPDVYKFITAMYKAGAKGSFNSLAVNPYARTTSEMLGKLKKIRKIMNRAHDTKATLWVTEIGWSDAGPRAEFRVGAKGQARLLAKIIPAFKRARSSLRLRGFVYFSWRDGLPYAPNFKDFWGLHTGLLKAGGAAKPALAAFKRAVAKL